jgi:hypothetical protein
MDCLPRWASPQSPQRLRLRRRVAPTPPRLPSHPLGAKNLKRPFLGSAFNRTRASHASNERPGEGSPPPRTTRMPAERRIAGHGDQCPRSQGRRRAGRRSDPVRARRPVGQVGARREVTSTPPTIPPKRLTVCRGRFPARLGREPSQTFTAATVVTSFVRSACIARVSDPHGAPDRRRLRPGAAGRLRALARAWPAQLHRRQGQLGRAARRLQPHRRGCIDPALRSSVAHANREQRTGSMAMTLPSPRVPEPDSSPVPQHLA